MRAKHISAIFGQVLREQRMVRGFSQEGLALRADIDRAFLSQMERGVRQPSITTLIKLSWALGVQPSVLIRRLERLIR